MPRLFLTTTPGLGRGVKFKELAPRVHDQLIGEAGKIVGAEASMIELKLKEWSLGVQRFIAGVTLEDGYKTIDELRSPECKWKTVTEQDVDKNFDEWFNAKDVALLTDLFRKHHEVSQDEIAAISGKVQEVSEV